jgi:hypothetical protein
MHNKLQLRIYRKRTTTDLIIHNDSCHPYEHKKASINFLINRMNKYPITHNNANKEETIIKTMLNNNNYPQNTIQHKQSAKNKNNNNNNNNNNNKWPPSHFSHQKPEKLLNY